MFLNLYWSLLIIAFGLCVGSFLNVVIYRWPRDLSVRRPLWSFCPACRSTLRWCDNLPVLSYVLLRGRCRYCRAPISLQYPIVELATAFAFLLIYDAFFVAKLRAGITDVSADWPMLLAHWVLAAGLIVITVMDLEAYIVDIRVTWIMAGLGLLLHAIWTPYAGSPDRGWIRPGASLTAVSLAAVVGLAVAAVLWLRREPHEIATQPHAPDGAAHTHSGAAEGACCQAPGQSSDSMASGSDAMACAGPAEGTVPAEPQPAGRPGGLAWAWALFGLLIVLIHVGAIVWSDWQSWTRIMEPPRDASGRLVWPAPPTVEPGVVRTGVGLLILFVAMTLFASHPHPEEDQEIVEAIDAEAADSRRHALHELGLLSPALVLIAATVFAIAGNPGLTDRLDALLRWQALGSWQPLSGMATALAGWVVGGALAWLTRILGTLGLGKEAFGMGDVHIMGAIGAIAGASVAFVGFFAASLLALLGMMLILFRRQGRALPYGPWLALASFIIAVYQDRILAYLQIR